MLIWLQMSWLILLFGCTFTYSMQNIFHYTFTEDVSNISPLYMRKLTVVTAAIIASRFRKHEKPLTQGELSSKYDLPIRIVSEIVSRLQEAGIVNFVILDKSEDYGVAPAVNLDRFTLGQLLEAIDVHGRKDFVPKFNERYTQALAMVDHVADSEYSAASKILLIDIPVK